MVSYGTLRQVKAGVVWRGEVWLGKMRQGKAQRVVAGWVWFGLFRLGQLRRGLLWQARLGKVR